MSLRHRGQGLAGREGRIELLACRGEMERQKKLLGDWTQPRKMNAGIGDMLRRRRQLQAAMVAGQIVPLRKIKTSQRKLEAQREEWVRRMRSRTRAPRGDNYQFYINRDILSKTTDPAKAYLLYAILGTGGVKALAADLKSRGKNWDETLEADWDEVIAPTLEMRDSAESLAMAILRKDMLVRRFGKNGKADLDRAIKELGDTEWVNGWKVIFSNWDAIKPWIEPNKAGRSKTRVTPELVVTLIRNKLSGRRAKAAKR